MLQVFQDPGLRPGPPDQIEQLTDALPFAISEFEAPTKRGSNEVNPTTKRSRFYDYKQIIPRTHLGKLPTSREPELWHGSFDLNAALNKDEPNQEMFDLNVPLGLDGEPAIQFPGDLPLANSSSAAPRLATSHSREAASGAVEQSNQESQGSSQVESQNLINYQLGSIDPELMRIGLGPPNTPLTSHRFPKSGLHESTTKFFMRLLDAQIAKKCPNSGQLQPTQGRCFENLPLASYDWTPANSDSIIRVSRVLYPNTQAVKSPSGLGNALKPLVRWIIYTHLTLLARMKITGAEEQQNRCQAMFTWLLSEIFEPIGSPPLLGILPKGDTIYNPKSFRPVQLELLDFLSLETVNYEAYTTSVTAVGIWYKIFYKDSWSSHFQSDDHFRRVMESDIRQTTYAKEPLPDWNSAVPEVSSASSIDNFQLDALSEILKHELPARLKILLESPRNNMRHLGNGKVPLAENTMVKIEHIFERFPKRGNRRRKITCQGLPITMNLARHPTQTDSIRLTRRSTLDVLNKEDVLSRLEIIFEWTYNLHEKLQRSLSARHPGHTAIPHHKFLAWFYKTAFLGSSCSLPILGIGHFQDRMNIPNNDNMFDFKNQFGQIQIYLIERLYKGISVTEFFEFSTSLLGYWYFTQHPGFSKNFFDGKERNYFAAVKSALERLECTAKASYTPGHPMLSVLLMN
ncbi:hypothetical protein H4Q26_001256 [Puccinia striiformis f. sp. tritici PST-130]|nr:hypothetical protein H4Q26_001256 [Puccinia striiformis f. sp. tritici PST-130]